MIFLEKEAKSFVPVIFFTIKNLRGDLVLVRDFLFLDREKVLQEQRII